MAYKILCSYFLLFYERNRQYQDGGCLWEDCSVSQLCLTLQPQTVAHQSPLPMEFSSQEYWSGLPFPTPGDLPHSGIEPVSLASPVLADVFLITSANWEAPMVRFSSVQFSCSVVSNSLGPHESQHARPPSPSPTPGVHSDSCLSSRWCHPAISSLLLLPPIPPSIRVFSNESALRMRLPKYWSLSFSISPSNEHPGLISFRIDKIAAAAAAKSLQSCPTLCDPIDGSLPGSTVPGILQARILEWVGISFSNAWKWKVKVKSLSRVWPSVTPWTAAFQAPPSMGFSRQEYWSGVPLIRLNYPNSLPPWNTPSLCHVARHCRLLEKPEYISLPTDVGTWHVTLLGQWNVSGHDLSRDLKCAPVVWLGVLYHEKNGPWLLLVQG